MVEHNLAKVGVAGSNPVSRSIMVTGERQGGSLAVVRRRSQVVKAEVCKTSIQRFESARRLHREQQGGRGRAGVAELGDAAGLNPAGPSGPWGFNSPPRHQTGCGR